MVSHLNLSTRSRSWAKEMVGNKYWVSGVIFRTAGVAGNHNLNPCFNTRIDSVIGRLLVDRFRRSLVNTVAIVY